MITWRSLSL